MPRKIKNGSPADTFVPTDDDPFGGIIACDTVFEDLDNSLQRVTFESGYVTWQWFEAEFDAEAETGISWFMAGCADEPQWLELSPLAQAALDSHLEAEAAQ